MNTSKALEAVQALAGVYTGSSLAYGFDGKESQAWSEKVTATDPTVAGDKAFLTVGDEMVFQGGKTYSLEWTDGFFLSSDGSSGQRYFDIRGHVTIENEIAPNTWTMIQPLSPYDIAGAPKEPLVTT